MAVPPHPSQFLQPALGQGPPRRHCVAVVALGWSPLSPPPLCRLLRPRRCARVRPDWEQRWGSQQPRKDVPTAPGLGVRGLPSHPHPRVQLSHTAVPKLPTGGQSSPPCGVLYLEFSPCSSLLGLQCHLFHRKAWTLPPVEGEGCRGTAHALSRPQALHRVPGRSSWGPGVQISLGSNRLRTELCDLSGRRPQPQFPCL